MNPTIRYYGIVLLCLFFMACYDDDKLICPKSENIVDLTSEISPIHDPSMIKMDDTYYLFSSSPLCSFYTSKDMEQWERTGQVFDAVPAWAVERIPEANHIGAPDISFYKGKYILFYQTHKSWTCQAVIGLAVNKTLSPFDPEYQWEDKGMVIESQPYFDAVEILCGNSNATYNAIDPHFYLDKDGTPWLAFGSTVGGIKLTKLNPDTLMPADNPPKFITLARRSYLQEDPIIEGAYIIERNNYYYLFVSYNSCCKQEETKYHIRVGRSKRITGPYFSRGGIPMQLEGGTLVIDNDDNMIGCGHNEVFSENGIDWLVHHAYDSQQNYEPVLNIRKLKWDEEGWPTVCE